MFQDIPLQINMDPDRTVATHYLYPLMLARLQCASAPYIASFDLVINQYLYVPCLLNSDKDIQKKLL